ncbi:hypothetical protein LX32DRAFT_252653 [Colletotrichum zoysiae]|uniref:Uncharacterized protein n=1 Tax=Colletotrichum zoysiae TaxID=1216348 RepID=A0AAD9HW21_9PEZI|nr:hypothetical protein LX32DRAFT_252653 [Colletotrichum zoysiae]
MSRTKDDTRFGPWRGGRRRRKRWMTRWVTRWVTRWMTRGIRSYRPAAVPKKRRQKTHLPLLLSLVPIPKSFSFHTSIFVPPPVWYVYPVERPLIFVPDFGTVGGYISSSRSGPCRPSLG